MRWILCTPDLSIPIPRSSPDSHHIRHRRRRVRRRPRILHPLSLFSLIQTHALWHLLVRLVHRFGGYGSMFPVRVWLGRDFWMVGDVELVRVGSALWYTTSELVLESECAGGSRTDVGKRSGWFLCLCLVASRFHSIGWSSSLSLPLLACGAPVGLRRYAFRARVAVETGEGGAYLAFFRVWRWCTWTRARSEDRVLCWLPD